MRLFSCDKAFFSSPFQPHFLQIDLHLLVFQQKNRPLLRPVFRGWGGGILAFSGAPRSAIINCRLCRILCLFYLLIRRQSVLLPQNGSHPLIPPLTRITKGTAHHFGVLCLLAGVEGFEPPNDGVRVRCLTAWRHPKILLRVCFCNGNFIKKMRLWQAF